MSQASMMSKASPGAGGKVPRFLLIFFIAFFAFAQAFSASASLKTMKESWLRRLQMTNVFGSGIALHLQFRQHVLDGFLDHLWQVAAIGEILGISI